MRFKFLIAAIPAAFPAAPIGAADRPAGTEPGQARHAAENDNNFGTGGYDEPGPRGGVDPNEIGPGWESIRCRIFRLFAGDHDPSVYRG